MIEIFHNNQIEAEIQSANHVYTVRDYKKLNNLVLSSVVLHSTHSTRGHTHKGQEEVYFFVFGTGKIEVSNKDLFVDDQEYNVSAGDIIVIPDGVFHRVHNTGETDLVFHTVYNKLKESTTIYAGTN